MLIDLLEFEITDISCTAGMSDITQPSSGPEAAAPFMQKPTALLDTAFNLFGYLPPDDDLRWSFLKKYNSVREDFHFRAMNFDNAWGAIYLSNEQSWRSGFVTTINPENTLQLDRALDNLGHRQDVLRRFEQAQADDGIDVRLRLTDALASHPNRARPAETPCPEALYQLRLYVGNYLGRVGFNLHTEHGTSVVSVVNVQGVPGGRSDAASFQDNYGLSPFNYLVQRVQEMASEDEAGLVVRGIMNPKKGNSRLYYGVFQNENVPMYKARHKPSYTSSQ